MICSICDKPIARDEKTASGPDGRSHIRCAKVGTAHGELIDIITLYEALGRLKKRVQDLEQVAEEQAITLEHHASNIPFRIG